MPDTLSPGTSLLADFQVGGISKSKIDNVGTLDAVVGRFSTSMRSPVVITDTSTTLVIQNSKTYSTADTAVEMAASTHTNTSGSSVGVSILPTYNQASGTAANTDLLISRTETLVGSGEQLLIEGEVDAVTVYKVDNAGSTSVAAGTNGAFTNTTFVTATVNSSAGATLTASGLIPDGAMLIGLTARVLTGFGTTTGLTDFDVGDGSDVDRWANSLAITATTTMDPTDSTADAGGWFQSATDVVLTSVGGNFDGTGQIIIHAHVITLNAPTS